MLRHRDCVRPRGPPLVEDIRYIHVLVNSPSDQCSKSVVAVSGALLHGATPISTHDARRATGSKPKRKQNLGYQINGIIALRSSG